MKKNKSSRAYLRAVGRSLSCSHSERAAILSDLEASVMEFIAESQEEVSVEQLAEHFGEPSAVGGGYVDKRNIDWLKSRSRQLAWWRTATVASVAFFVLSVVVAFYLGTHRGEVILMYGAIR